MVLSSNYLNRYPHQLETWYSQTPAKVSLFYEGNMVKLFCIKYTLFTFFQIKKKNRDFDDPLVKIENKTKENKKVQKYFHPSVKH